MLPVCASLGMWREARRGGYSLGFAVAMRRVGAAWEVLALECAVCSSALESVSIRSRDVCVAELLREVRTGMSVEEWLECPITLVTLRLTTEKRRGLGFRPVAEERLATAKETRTDDRVLAASLPSSESPAMDRRSPLSPTTAITLKRSRIDSFGAPVVGERGVYSKSSSIQSGSLDKWISSPNSSSIDPSRPSNLPKTDTRKDFLDSSVLLLDCLLAVNKLLRGAMRSDCFEMGDDLYLIRSRESAHRRWLPRDFRAHLISFGSRLFVEVGEANWREGIRGGGKCLFSRISNLLGSLPFCSTMFASTESSSINISCAWMEIFLGKSSVPVSSLIGINAGLSEDPSTSPSK